MDIVRTSGLGPKPAPSSSSQRENTFLVKPDSPGDWRYVTTMTTSHLIDVAEVRLFIATYTNVLSVDSQTLPTTCALFDFAPMTGTTPNQPLESDERLGRCAPSCARR